MGSVVISMTSWIKRVFLKKLDVAPINVWLLQEHKRLIHNIAVHGACHLDGYDIKAINDIKALKDIKALHLNLNRENE